MTGRPPCRRGGLVLLSIYFDELRVLRCVPLDWTVHDRKNPGGVRRGGQGREAVRLPAALQNKTTSYGGYGYNFWGPNLGLRPEFAKSWEIGAEVSFFNNRLGLDGTVYRKVTHAQIVENVRGSYATGFVLFNLNGASTRARGLELTVRATPILKPQFSWI